MQNKYIMQKILTLHIRVKCLLTKSPNLIAFLMVTTIISLKCLFPVFFYAIICIYLPLENIFYVAVFKYLRCMYLLFCNLL